MSKAWDVVFCVISWVYFAFAVMFGAASGSVVSAILFGISALLVIPTRLIRNLWSRVAGNRAIWIKPLVIFLVFCVALFSIPSGDLPSTDETDPSGTEFETTLTTETETEKQTETETEKQTETETEKQTETETEIETETETELETEAAREETESETETIAERETDAVIESETEAETETEKQNEAETQAPTAEKPRYILNTDSKKFHYYPGCYAAKKIKAENYVEYQGSRAEVEAMGYDLCGICSR